MSSLQLLTAFAEAARRGSFAGAARELGLSPSAVVKNIARLENTLGVRLFQRTTRRVALTQDGAALYERCRRVLDELAELQSVATAASDKPSGTLRVDAPLTYGKQVVVPVLAQLALRYTDLKYELRLSDQRSELIGSGLDAVVRIGPVDDSRLVARQIDRQHLAVYAAPAYLARKGRPKHPDSLAQHDCLAFRLPSTGRERPWHFVVNRANRTFAPEARHVINDGEGLVAAATLGLGLIQAPSYMADAAVACGELEEVLQRFRPPPLPVSVLFASHRHIPPRLRVFVDAMAQRARSGTHKRRTEVRPTEV
jgi:LysR family transcriptional regulator for bpeEF and oprC